MTETSAYDRPKCPLWRWAVVFGVGLGVYLFPAPQGVSREAWVLLAIFIATIVGSIVQPLTGRAIVLLGWW